MNTYICTVQVIWASLQKAEVEAVFVRCSRIRCKVHAMFTIVEMIPSIPHRCFFNVMIRNMYSVIVISDENKSIFVSNVLKIKDSSDRLTDHPSNTN